MNGIRSVQRKDRLIKEKRHDVYMEKDKLPEPTKCNRCGAVYSKGRWTWKTISNKITKATCPACRRIQDKYPAGIIELKGNFFNKNKSQILNLIRNIEKKEKEDRPLERIMLIKDVKDYTVVTTTGIHIARRLGEALSRSYKGNYSFQYADGDNSIRVYWDR